MGPTGTGAEGSTPAKADAPAARAAGGAAPPQQAQFFLSLLPATHGIRAFTVPDVSTYLAATATEPTFSAHAISFAQDLDLAREVCACLDWTKRPGRVTYAALPDTARQRLHGLLGLGSNATFDQRALTLLMAKAPGQHGPPGGKQVRPFPSSPALFSPSPVAS